MPVIDRSLSDCRYKVGFAFEFGLLFLLMTLCQMFVYTFHFDWQIHDPLIVTERASDAPTSSTLKNRGVMILGDAGKRSTART